MSPFHLECTDDTARLRLRGEVTIEHARDLHAALLAGLRPGQTLVVNAAGATRLDAAALQVLVAAARLAGQAVVAASSPAWEGAFRRYAIAAPFSAPANPSSC